MNALSAHDDPDDAGAAYHNHMPVYWRIFISLAVLTGIEFGISLSMDPAQGTLYMLGIVVLVLLAAVKAALVARVFMHLKYDPKILSLLCVLPVILGSPLVLFCIWDGINGPSFG